MSIASLLEAGRSQANTVSLSAADDWMQGRTLYGGASALVAYVSARETADDLPPLRAAQIGFVAPIAGDFEVSAQIVRQGRSVTQVRAEIHVAGALALTTFWLFGAGREANAVHAADDAPQTPAPPEEAEEMRLDRAPAFLRENFEIRRAQSHSGPGAPVVRRWARLKQRELLDPVSELVLMGDVLPPGAMRAMRRQGPISSINWSFNVLDPAPETRAGWWLSENASQHADVGYSSERLRLWDASGRQVLDGMQSVAIFG